MPSDMSTSVSAPVSTSAATPRPGAFVARQAILDIRGRVFGYELLYRAGPNATACTLDKDLASARTMTDAVLDIGVDVLTGGRPAFINLTRALLVDEACTLLPRDAAVFEVLEDVAVDADVITACRRLHARGYRLALDDFTPGSPAEALLPYAAFVKVDVMALPPATVEAVATRLARPGLVLVAEKVESLEVYERCQRAGYSLFQGYFFQKPVLTSGAALPAQHVACLRLLSALNRPDLTVNELEALVKQDASVSLRVLRCVNSAAFAVRREVSSIREAIVLLGLGPIRKWASIWCLAGLGAGRTPELATLALLRARSCERLGEGVPHVVEDELFLVGLCSLLDAMLERPMPEALKHMALAPSVEQALLGQPTASRRLLEAVLAYERGHWDDAVTAAQSAAASDLSLPTAYAAALTWMRELGQV
jgi:EAL and modified HD-GYP domain-containing signal transduction protein